VEQNKRLTETVRVFIGTEPKTEIARKVLECSIRRQTDSKVEIVPMLGSRWEYDTTGFKQGTGFSLRRWLIPEYCNWQGRAIYLDADQLLLADIWLLWRIPERQPKKDCAAWMTYQPSKFSKKPHPNSSVMVIDCAAAKQQTFFNFSKLTTHLRAEPTQKTYADVMYPTWLEPAPVEIDIHWNALNVYDREKTKLLHFTKEDSQVWYNPKHPLAHLWKRELSKAIALGYITKEEFVAALGKWGEKEDWRKMNGLHPAYKTFLSEFK